MQGPNAGVNAGLQHGLLQVSYAMYKGSACAQRYLQLNLWWMQMMLE